MSKKGSFFKYSGPPEPTIESLRREIKSLLFEFQPGLMGTVRQCLIAPGISGSLKYDQAVLLKKVIECDEQYGSPIEKQRESLGLTWYQLYPHIVAVLKEAGYKFYRGRMLNDESTDDRNALTHN